MSSSNILILGLNSFSGAVTASRLLASGLSLVGLNRSQEVNPLYRPYRDLAHSDNLYVHEYGSNYETEKIIDICNQFDIEIVFNFASQSMVAQSWEAPWDWYETNCVWLSRLTAAFVKWGKLKRFIHYTTPEVYGSTYGWISEDSLFNPTTPYAISRAAGDFHLAAEHKRNRFPVIFTRAANVFGPYQQRYRIIPKALISAASLSDLHLHGGGFSERSFIFMEDVANALLRIMISGKVGSTYHISTQRMITIRRVVEMCYESYELDPNLFLKSTQDRPGKDQAYRLNSSKIRHELGWEDKVTLEQGITQTKAWVDGWLSELMMQPIEYVHKA